MAKRIFNNPGIFSRLISGRVENEFSDVRSISQCGRTFSMKSDSSSGVRNKLNRGVSSRPDRMSFPGMAIAQHYSSNEINMSLNPVTDEVKNYLEKKDIHFTEGYTSFSTTCPRFETARMQSQEKQKLFINSTTGCFVCLSCKKTGNWKSLQENINRHLSNEFMKKKKHMVCFEHLEPISPSDKRRVDMLWNKAEEFSKLTYNEKGDIMQKFSLNGILTKTLDRFMLRYSRSTESLLLPWFHVDYSLRGLKILTLTVDADNKSSIHEETIPRLNYHGLFGWNTILPQNKEVVLTSNEFDALVVQQEGKMQALSLPKGCSTLPQEVLPLLEHFNKIIIWFGNDLKSWESARLFCKKLNEKRCFLVRPVEDHPNPLSAFHNRRNISQILATAQPVINQAITSFQSLRDDVFAELTHKEQVAGIKWKRYTKLNDIMKGHRRGELTVFTGPTGAGKTTWISDYSLDLCMQGVNTLWGSFEIHNVRLAKMMIQQFALKNLTKEIHEFPKWANMFEQLPMFFMTFHGQESIYKVVETMSHAVYVHDIAHIVVDNLQFMMGTDLNSASADRFHKQDQIVAAFRKFATHRNCHVTLVIHPRKENEDTLLTKASIFGSAKATQEADNVLILQDPTISGVRGSKKFVQIAKNRFDGSLGTMVLKFNKDTLSFADKPSTKPVEKVQQISSSLEDSDEYLEHDALNCALDEDHYVEVSPYHD
ncbi:twinkle mtDNA helicase-like isoform X2 [Tubulanus polymorphus]|uniref:twinkle mtDNA helicase-like isoform X2 n=1 Tax=Tubulanus polymorphus TaxID=672921 RepID=UPI003DA2FC04